MSLELKIAVINLLIDTASLVVAIYCAAKDKYGLFAPTLPTHYSYGRINISSAKPNY